MPIGAVVKTLKSEFPATTVSKVRFLEDKGLVKPHRTASGYRKYSLADVERIRYILTQQRNSYAPLRVIHENLVALDAGHQADDPRPARLITDEGKSVAPSGRSTVSVRELADLTGVSREVLEEYTRLGLISPDLGGHFPSFAVATVNLIGKAVASGVPARNLRSVRTGAERSADIIEQVTVGVTRRDRSADRERAKAEAVELSEVFAELHAQYLHSALASLDV
ncbi:MAG: MerR family transcriptional regulator [Scrofimicrobium sp.]